MMSQVNLGQPSTAAGQQSGPTLQGTTQSSNYLSKEDLFRGKNVSGLWNCSVPVLQFVFKSTVQSRGKGDAETYTDFIKRIYPDLNINKVFNKDQRAHLDQTSCDSFDVTLIFSLLHWFSDEVERSGTEEFKKRVQDDQTFEHWFQKAKDLRNDMQHDRKKLESPSFLGDLELVLMELLEKSKTLGIAADEINRMKTQIRKELVRIQNLPLDDETLMLVSEVLCFENFKKDVESFCERNYSVRLSAESSLSLGEIFYPITLMVKSEDGSNTTATVLCEDILANTVSSFVIVKGVPGSGKTTLLRTLFKSWSSQKDEDRVKSKALHYNIAVMISCRDQKYQNVAEILRKTHQKTFGVVSSDATIKKALASLTILAIVDAYDELNDASRKLMEDVMDYQERFKEKMKVIISSRPEAAGTLIEELGRRGISTHETTMAPVKDKSKYLQLYEEALVKKGKGLVEAFSTLDESVQDFLDTPVLLTMFVKLYTFSRERVGRWRTQIDVMSNYIDMTRKDIMARVEEGQDKQGKKPEDPEDLSHEILRCVGSQALEMYADEKLNLNEEEFYKFRKSYPALDNLSVATVKSVLSCVLTAEQSATGMGWQHEFPHLTIQEVLAAKLVTEKLESIDPQKTESASQDGDGQLPYLAVPHTASRSEGTSQTDGQAHPVTLFGITKKIFESPFKKSSVEQTTESASQDGDGHDRRRIDGTTAFKRVIKEITGVKVDDIKRYANIVKYVTLLLNKHQKLKSHGPILADVMRDIISAMEEGDIFNNPRLDYCLDVIAASGCDGSVAKLVTRALEESGGVGDGWWWIRTGNLILPSVIMLRLLKQPEGVKYLRVDLYEALTAPHWTALGELVDVISQRYSHAGVDIKLYHSHEECVPVDASVVEKMKGIKELSWFIGCVAEEESLLALRDCQWCGYSELHLSTPKPGLLHLLGGSDGRCGAQELFFTVSYTEQDLPARPLPVGCDGSPPELYIRGCPEDAQEQQLIDLIDKLAPKYQKEGREYEGYGALHLTHCGMTKESVEAVLGGLQQRHLRNYYGGGNTRAERRTKDDGKCPVGYISHTHQDGTVCWRLYLKD